MAFNERLKELRTGLDLTQKEFAQKIGLSAASIIAYERNEKKPSFDVLISIAEQFNVSLDWLCLDRTDHEYKTVKWSDLLCLVYSILKNKHVPVEVKACKESSYGDDAVSLIFAKTLVDPADINPDLKADEYMVYKTFDGDIFNYPDFYDQISEADLTCFESPIYKFITTYEKMKDLLNSGSITEDLFNLWLDDEFKKNNRLVWNSPQPDFPDWLEEGAENGND